MKYSLLQKNSDSGAVCEIMYDLSIDRAVKKIVSDQKRADYFLSVLERPLSDIENIKYRQEIFNDFDTIEGLLSDVKTVFSRYDRIKSDWQEMKLGDVSSHGGEINPEVLLDHTFSSLKVTAIFPSTIASFFASIGEVLEKYDIKSQGLIAIRDKCLEMKSNDALSQIVDISQLFRYQSPEYFDFTVISKLDETMRVAECDISLITEHKEEKGFRLFGNKKNDGYIPVGSENAEEGNDPCSDAARMLCDALCRIDSALTQVTSQIYDLFFGISSEIMFYEAAIEYAKAARDGGVPLIMPKLLPCEDDRISATGLRELMLLANGAGKNTVPNDVMIMSENCGLLVKGMTDSGKTVYLRAIGAAQLFAQAGLPVLAENAELSVRNGIFSHFSSAEEEFLKVDDAGRFDQEAKEIARIINILPQYSLLLLNETFQTTSYKEGTESIAEILRYMPLLKTKYIFVTHLTGLFEYMKNENVLLCHTSDEEKERYKILSNR